jgi:hypothetical protein
MNKFLVASCILPIILIVFCTNEARKNGGLISESLLLLTISSIFLFLVSIGILLRRMLNSADFGKLPPIRRVLLFLLLLFGGLPFVIKWDTDEEKRKKLNEGKPEE